MADYAELKRLLDRLKRNPTDLHKPELKFFKDYLLSLNARLPVGDDELDSELPELADDVPSFSRSAQDTGHSGRPTSNEPAAAPGEELFETEEKDPDVIDTPDAIVPEEHVMGDTNRAVTDEELERAQAAKDLGQAALNEGRFDEAAKHFTEALQLNPSAAMMYASRGNVFLKLKRPNACILDCDAAVEINPNSAKAYKIRGRAHALLGNWEKSLQDLQRANSLDYDDETYEEAKRIKVKVEQHRARQQARKQREQAKREHSASGSGSPGSAAGPPGGFDFANLPGGLPAGLRPEMLSKLASNPTILKLMQNPKVAAAFAAVARDPSKMAEVGKDPEVAAAMQEFMNAMSS